MTQFARRLGTLFHDDDHAIFDFSADGLTRWTHQQLGVNGAVPTYYGEPCQATDLGGSNPGDFGHGAVDVPGSSDPSSYADGVGGTSGSVAASGNQQIDGLLTGTRWTNASITYTDPDSAGDYQSGYFVDRNGNGVSAQNEGFGRISAGQLMAVHTALNQTILTQPAGAGGFSVEGFTNLGIEYGTAGSGTATLRYANTSDNGTGLGYFPASTIYGGDGWLGTSIQSPVQGNYAWNNTLHEVGHTLGLKHGQETGGPGNTALPSNVDSLEFTVMTYRSYIGDDTSGYNNEQYGFPQTYMMLDIAALQYMYGADFTSNGTDTVYTWNPTTGQSYVNGSLAQNPGANRIFSTIWDGNGVDTYNLSNYTTNLRIDLRPGESSTFSAVQLANLGGGPNGGYARGNVFNALQYQGDARSLIENAIGGSGNDTFMGNQANNAIRGNGGNDTIDGAGGTDTAIFSGNRSQYTLTALSGNGVRVVGPDGTDQLANVEFLQFADQTISWPPTASPGSISINDVTITEGQSGTQILAFTVTRTGGTAAFSVNFATANNSASSGSDYVATSGTLSFASGVNTQTIQVTINGDTAVETNETFFVNLSNPTNGATIADSQGIATITNDDASGDDYADSFSDTTAPFGTVAVNGSRTGSIEANGDHDWIGVQLVAGQTYVMRLQGSPSGNGTLPDSYLRLHNSAGTLLLENDDSTTGLDSMITFRATTTGTYYLNVGAYNDQYSGTYRVSVARQSVSNDFNGDGMSDIMWKHTGGTISEWLSTGNGFTPNAFVGGIASGWHSEGAFDFSGDGRADLLWRNDTTGQFTIWNSTGTGFTPNSYVNGVSNAWSVAALADFNGDGFEDMIFRNTNGTFTEWQSTGTGFTQNVFVGSVDNSWHLAAAADFSGDGKADLLWRNDNGSFTEWQSNGNGFTPNVVVGSVDPAWHVLTTGDFNGDGKDDLLFRHNNGTVTEWQSNGNGFTANVFVAGVGTDWQLAQTGDFNGDGRDDLLWRNTNGTFSEWQSTGNSFTPNVVVGNVAPDWNPITHHYDVV